MSDTLVQKLNRRFFYGWVIVAVFTVAGIAQAGQFNPTIGVFIKPVTEDFGWDRSVFIGALSIGTILGGLLALGVGPALDRFGPRFIVAAGFALVGLSLLGFAFVQGLWQFYLIIIVMRVALQGMVHIGTSVTISKWFVRLRGRAVSISFAGQRFGNGVTPLYAQALVSEYSWRVGAATLGLVALVTAVLPAILFLRRRPEDIGLRPDGDARAPSAERRRLGTEDDPEISFTLREALRTPKFYLALFSVSAGLFVFSGINLNLIAYLSDQGIDPGHAALVVAVWAVFGFIGGIVAGPLADRYQLRLLMSGSYLGLGLAMVLLLRADTVATAMAFAVAYGLLFGAVVTLGLLMYPTYFGRESLGAITGITQLVHTGVNAFGPLAAALVFDLTGGYGPIFLAFLAVCLLCGVVVLNATPPARPGRPLAAAES